MLRKIDELGRILLPAEFRQALHIKKEDELEIILKINEMVIKKAISGCVFCSAASKLVWIGDLCACRSCIERLHNAQDHEVLYPVRPD